VKKSFIRLTFGNFVNSNMQESTRGFANRYKIVDDL